MGHWNIGYWIYRLLPIPTEELTPYGMFSARGKPGRLAVLEIWGFGTFCVFYVLPSCPVCHCKTIVFPLSGMGYIRYRASKDQGSFIHTHHTPHPPLAQDNTSTSPFPRPQQSHIPNNTPSAHRQIHRLHSNGIRRSYRFARGVPPLFCGERGGGGKGKVWLLRSGEGGNV